MKQTINAFVLIILMTLMSIFSGSYIAMHLQTVTARQYNTAVIERVQASNFSPNIIAEIEAKSIEDGYPTTISDFSLYEDMKNVSVVTEYVVQFPIFGIVKEGVIEGYAK